MQQGRGKILKNKVKICLTSRNVYSTLFECPYGLTMRWCRRLRLCR
jgi:hypothetical protein